MMGLNVRCMMLNVRKFIQMSFNNGIFMSLRMANNPFEKYLFNQGKQVYALGLPCIASLNLF